MTSSTVTGWNWRIEVCRDVVDVNDGGWASAVAARTLATLSSMKLFYADVVKGRHAPTTQ